METIKVDILDPKAKKVLKQLEDDNLIRISRSKMTDYQKQLERIRRKSPSLSQEEIEEEVKYVRKSRKKEHDI